MAHVPLGPSLDLNNRFGTQTRPTGGPRGSFTAADVCARGNAEHRLLHGVNTPVFVSFFLSFFLCWVCMRCQSAHTQGMLCMCCELTGKDAALDRRVDVDLIHHQHSCGRAHVHSL
jgi:hypothetical protein